MDGLTLDFQETKDLIIVQLEEMSTLEDKLPMLIINVVYMLESKSQELTLRSFQVNGNSKLDHALELNKETTFGLLDISCKDALKNITFQ
jgi:hypothetical protein